MDREVVYLYNGMLLRHKKECKDTICSSIRGPTEYHTKWSKTKTNIIYILYVEF